MSHLVVAPFPSCAASGRGRCGVCAPLFGGALDPRERTELDRMLRHVDYAPKDQLFSEGDQAHRVFNVSEGVVRLYKLLADGRRQVVGFSLPGDFLGVTLAEQHSLSADAIGRVSVCSFPRADFMRFVDGNLTVLRRMNEYASRELSRAQDRMLLLGRFTAEEKMAAFILNWRERLGPAGRNAAVTPLPMSRRDIADYLGLTIETVSRTFSRLEKEGLIAVVSGGVRIEDQARAADLACAAARR